jgi:hypothetical protein
LNISPTRREEAEEANKNCKTPRDVQAFGVDIQIALQSFALTELFGDRDTAWPRATLLANHHAPSTFHQNPCAK